MRPDPPPAPPPEHHGDEPATLPQKLLAEVLGTFALTLVAAGGEVINTVSGEVSRNARVVAPGMLIMAMIYALGPVSGAHFNPAVTLAFVGRRDFPPRLVVPYWGAQFVGAILAAVLLRALFGPVGRLGANHPEHGIGAALVFEIVLTWLLVFVILSTAARHSMLGPQSALPVGATIALCGLFASPISGASMNPARSLGPALVNGSVDGAWIYVVGPVLGATLATLCVYVLEGPRKPGHGEKQAARGEA